MSTFELHTRFPKIVLLGCIDPPFCFLGGWGFFTGLGRLHWELLNSCALLNSVVCPQEGSTKAEERFLEGSLEALVKEITDRASEHG